MKIAFMAGAGAPFHGKSLEERPLGGTETAVIRLAQALDALGHRVFVCTNIKNPPATKPLYIPTTAAGDIGEVDVLIVVRELFPLFAPIPRKLAFFWTGDSFDQLQHLGLGDRRVIERLGAFLAVSNWQADRVCAVSGFPRSKTWILRNGIDPRLFEGEEVRRPKRLIYSSTPFRGLALLPGIFTEIQKIHPDAELHIFSGMKVYEGANAQGEAIEATFKPTYEALANMPGVTVHGNVKQNELARHLMRSKILAYPNIFDETSCITAIEAMAAGCGIVTSRRGALPETIGDAGLFVEGDPFSLPYLSQFVRYICNLLSDDRAWNDLSQRGLARAQRYSWDLIAKELSDRFQNELAKALQGTVTSSVFA